MQISDNEFKAFDEFWRSVRASDPLMDYVTLEYHLFRPDIVDRVKNIQKEII